MVEIIKTSIIYLLIITFNCLTYAAHISRIHTHTLQLTQGVGYGWVDHLKEVGEKEVTDQMFSSAANRFPHNTPTTKEGYRYRMIFEEFFPGESAEKTVPGGKSIACSTERAMTWDSSFADRADPSGRAAGVHEDAYGESFVGSDEAKM